MDTSVTTRPKALGRAARFSSVIASNLFASCALLASFLASAHTLAATQTYFIAIEEIEWEYFPPTGTPANELDKSQRTSTNASANRVGTGYRKVIYRGYTDESFTTVSPQPPAQGILGPTLRVQVGDTLNVVLRNNAARPYSMTIQGISTDNKDRSEKSPSAEVIEPNETKNLKWNIEPEFGPGPADKSSIAWQYFSNVAKEKDMHSGLLGAVIVSRRGLGRSDAPPLDVQREFVLLTALSNENISWHASDNLRRLKNNKPERKGERYYASNLMANINGFMHDTLPALEMHACEKVRLYHLRLSSQPADLGLQLVDSTLLRDGHRTTTISTPSSTVSVADFSPTKVGRHAFSAAGDALAAAGIYGHFTVNPPIGTCEK
jgi:multicopper oxidase